MIALAVALGLATATGATGPRGRAATDLAVRLRQSAAAAQALQGPLDGGWTLWAGDRPLYVFQITDPAGGAAPLAGAWRRPEAAARPEPIEAITRKDDRLMIRLRGDGGGVRIRLRRRGRYIWSGQANEDGWGRPVSLRRSARGAAPPRVTLPYH